MLRRGILTSTGKSLIYNLKAKTHSIFVLSESFPHDLDLISQTHFIATLSPEFSWKRCPIVNLIYDQAFQTLFKTQKRNIQKGGVR
jgi:hypothetical protein